MTATTWSQTDLLREMNQVVETNLNRHIGVAKEWYPHEFIPWSDGRNFDGLMGGDAWSPDDAPISDVARSALIVNLLTEDNLPSLPPRDRADLRSRRRVGRVGPPLDGRGGPPRHRHARLHARQAHGRPQGA